MIYNLRKPSCKMFYCHNIIITIIDWQRLTAWRNNICPLASHGCPCSRRMAWLKDKSLCWVPSWVEVGFVSARLFADNELNICLFSVLSEFLGIAIASALVDISQQRVMDFKERGLNLKHRKHTVHHQGTCVWTGYPRSNTNPSYCFPGGWFRLICLIDFGVQDTYNQTFFELLLVPFSPLMQKKITFNISAVQIFFLTSQGSKRL